MWISSLRSTAHLHEVVGQQEVRNTLTHNVFVSTVAANELPLTNLRLHQQIMQVLDELLIFLEILWGWRNFWESRKRELRMSAYV